MGLSPTLWRTCRVLSGATRVALFRRIVETPGQTVSGLAKGEKISLARASQELRRLQSRGLVGVERTGKFVRYYPEADPLVSSAKPLLRAMQEACGRYSASKDGQTAALAKGVSHEKRIALVKVLSEGAMSVAELQTRLGMPAQTVWHHLRFLSAGGWVEHRGRKWALAALGHPLATSLLKLM